MCVDDYQFRHYSAKRQKICKRFIFRTEQEHQRTFLINISQFERFGQLCLCQILMHLSKKGLNVKDYSFHMPQLNITIQAGDRCRIPFNSVSFRQVIFEMKYLEKGQNSDNYQKLYFSPQEHIDKYYSTFCNPNPALTYGCQECSLKCSANQSSNDRKIQQQKSVSIQQQNKQMQMKVDLRDQSVQSDNAKIKELSSEGENKKHKEQEKTVQQALFKTKCWRMLHENCHFSLKNAANMIELSKKTLDDYFLVLRVAEYHGYNFKANLSKKIGHMRAFIRNQPVKITGRLPKQVKSFALVPNPDLTKFLPIQDWSKVQHIQQQQNLNSLQQNGQGNKTGDDNLMVPE